VTRLSEAIAELYSADPDSFVARRKELAAQARTAGDKAAAKEITALGKPTRSAWLINRLVRADPSGPARLAELSGELRAGEASLDGASIRRLSAARRDLIDELVRQAIGQTGQSPPSAALREEITDTFNAALADPQVASQVAAGTLLRSCRWAGFAPGIGTATEPAQMFARVPAAAPPASRAPAAASKPASSAKPTASPGDRKREQAEQALAEATQAIEHATAAQRERQEAVELVRRQLADEKERLTEAEQDTLAAQQALAQAQRHLSDAQRRQSEAERRLAAARQSLSRARQAAADAGAEVRSATAAQRRATQALARLS
jgi:hypothetical protein